jgi:hypothetical protein
MLIEAYQGRPGQLGVSGQLEGDATEVIWGKLRPNKGETGLIQANLNQSVFIVHPEVSTSNTSFLDLSHFLK